MRVLVNLESIELVAQAMGRLQSINAYNGNELLDTEIKLLDTFLEHVKNGVA